jgi:hypothetical protein
VNGTTDEEVKNAPNGTNGTHKENGDSEMDTAESEKMDTAESEKIGLMSTCLRIVWGALIDYMKHLDL